MALAHSRVTAQGQVSIPAAVRRRLGVGPGAVIEWDEADGHVVVRRAGRCTSGEIHEAIFPTGAPEPKRTSELTDGIRRHVRSRHARR
jgi:antitoxin PrlF